MQLLNTPCKNTIPQTHKHSEPKQEGDAVNITALSCLLTHCLSRIAAGFKNEKIDSLIHLVLTFLNSVTK